MEQVPIEGGVASMQLGDQTCLLSCEISGDHLIFVQGESGVDVCHMCESG